MRILNNKKQFCFPILIATAFVAVFSTAQAQPLRLAPESPAAIKPLFAPEFASGLNPGFSAGNSPEYFQRYTLEFFSESYSKNFTQHSSEILPETTAQPVATTVPAYIEQQVAMIQKIESEFGPYDMQLKEALRSLARQWERAGDNLQARNAYSRALQISRINEGLFTPNQINLVERLIRVEIGLAEWDAVNNHYEYLEHLYRKLYKVDDPRLEEGLRKVVAWHIDASNTNLKGNRVEHLRKVYTLLKLRLQVAELTLSGEDPLFDFLKQNIARSEYYLYLSSDMGRDPYRQRNRISRDVVNNE